MNISNDTLKKVFISLIAISIAFTGIEFFRSMTSLDAIIMDEYLTMVEEISPYSIVCIISAIIFAVVGFSVCRMNKDGNVIVGKTGLTIALFALVIALFICEYGNLYWIIQNINMVNDFGVFLKLLNPFGTCLSIVFFCDSNGLPFSYMMMCFCGYLLPYCVAALAIVVCFAKKTAKVKMVFVCIIVGLLCISAIMNGMYFFRTFILQIGDILDYYGINYVIYNLGRVVPVIGQLSFYSALLLLFWARPDCLKKSARPRTIPKAELDLLKTKLEIGAITEEQYRQQLEQLKYPQ